MEKTKHPYLKDILKTVGKVALIAGVTAIATPYLFGFAAGLFNAMFMGYVAGYATAGFGAYTAVKTACKDILTMRERVKKQQQEEHVNQKLEELTTKLNKFESKTTRPKEKQIQPNVKVVQQQPDKKIKWKPKWKPLFWRRAKQYDKAA